MAAAVLTLFSCKKDTEEKKSTDLGGDQSSMGLVGTTVTSASWTIAGVSGFTATTTSLTNGISTFTAQATIKNDILKNMVANLPGVTVQGDVVSTTDLKLKSTTEGIQLMTGPGAGILVKYGSAVGETYPIGSSGKVRTVTYRSTTDDYPMGLMMIKVVKVEEVPTSLKGGGVTKITYIANHKFGLVGVEFKFDDGTTATFPVSISTTN